MADTELPKDLPDFFRKALAVGFWGGILEAIGITVLGQPKGAPIGLGIALASFVIGKIVDRFFPAKQNESSETPDQSFEDLRKLSNNELRRQALDHVQAMRLFETAFRTSETTELLSRNVRNLTEEQRQAKWDADNISMAQRRAAHEREFAAAYRPKGLALLNEISSRLGITAGSRHQHGHEAMALTAGSLAGANPITEAADYLDRLARRLP